MIWMRRLLMAWAGILLVCAASAQEGEGLDPRELMTALPPAPQFAPRAVAAFAEADLMTFAEGMQVFRRKRLVLPGTILFDAGPIDGLEVVACLRGGKNHESLMVLDAGNGTALKAACLAWLGVEDDGMGVDEGSGDLPRGTPLRLRLRWCPDPLLEPASLVEADISTLVRNRVTDMGYPPLPYVYTGSRMEQTPVGSGDDLRMINRFMLEVTKSVAVNFNEPDALIAGPFPMSLWDNVFEVNTGNKPPFQDLPAQFTIERASLPLTLEMTAEGGLQHEGAALDDEALAALLRQHYLVTDADTMHAVAVKVQRSFARAFDRQVLARILRLAARERCWVIPIFIL
jgi:hypothetical protein